MAIGETDKVGLFGSAQLHSGLTTNISNMFFLKGKNTRVIKQFVIKKVVFLKKFPLSSSWFCSVCFVFVWSLSIFSTRPKFYIVKLIKSCTCLGIQWGMFVEHLKVAFWDPKPKFTELYNHILVQRSPPRGLLQMRGILFTFLLRV